MLLFFVDPQVRFSSEQQISSNCERALCAYKYSQKLPSPSVPSRDLHHFGRKLPDLSSQIWRTESEESLKEPECQMPHMSMCQLGQLPGCTMIHRDIITILLDHNWFLEIS